MKTLLLTLVLASTSLFSQTVRLAAITWEDTENPVGTQYTVYKAIGDCITATVFNKLNTIPVSSKNYTDMTVTTGQKLCYYVTAVFGGLESDPSVKADAQIKPRKVTNVVVTGN